MSVEKSSRLFHFLLINIDVYDATHNHDEVLSKAQSILL